MPDILIRNVPAEDLRHLDEQARQLGLSRPDFLRRQLHAQSQVTQASINTQQLRSFAERISDLTDPDVLDKAWS